MFFEQNYLFTCVVSTTPTDLYYLDLKKLELVKKIVGPEFLNELSMHSIVRIVAYKNRLNYRITRELEVNFRSTNDPISELADSKVAEKHRLLSKINPHMKKWIKIQQGLAYQIKKYSGTETPVNL